MTEKTNDDNDVLVPTAENEAYIFRPGRGTTMLDFKEIIMMQLISLMQNGPDVPPGSLRHQIISGERFHQLSPEAQKWMQPYQKEPS